MLLPIIKYGSSLLRQKTLEVSSKEKYRELVDNLFDSLNTKEGIGLAAPQIGVLKKIFVIDVSFNEEKEDEVQHFRKAFINPSVLRKSDEEVYYKEGCLSIPGIYEDVLRPESITVNYFDSDFNFIEENLDGIVARVFQHEYDHLEGVLFIDRLNPLKRKLLSGKLSQIKKSDK
ncbi:MAG TPA: peptide deformylase [Prolixibacteraceae bacterium]|nr:peptide deformylase [Prolixibacteraceae bacterium]